MGGLKNPREDGTNVAHTENETGWGLLLGPHVAAGARADRGVGERTPPPKSGIMDQGPLMARARIVAHPLFRHFLNKGTGSE